MSVVCCLYIILACTMAGKSLSFYRRRISNLLERRTIVSNISTCEAVELVRNAIDPYSMMGISADDMVYASVKRHMLSLFEKPEGECLHRISFAEFADKVTKTTRIQGEWVDEIPVFEPGDDYGQYTWNKCERI